MVLCLLVVLGCRGGEVADRARYLEALTSGELSACTDLHDDALRADCVTELAPRAAAAGRVDEALEACGLGGEGVWADECRFAVVDTQALVGPPAWEACQVTGRFQEYCTGHAVTRRIAAMEGLPLEVGREVELEAEILRRVQELDPPLSAEHRTMSVQTGLVRHLAARWTGVPFHAPDCGRAGLEHCRRAYLETMHETGVDREAVCAGPITSARVEEAGGKPWTDASHEATALAWQAVCRGLVQRSR